MAWVPQRVSVAMDMSRSRTRLGKISDVGTPITDFGHQALVQRTAAT